MGLRRTYKAPQGESSSKDAAETSKGKRKHKHPQKDEPTLPGVQKIKSSLRQTRRLLAKDNLAADVRVETERRLKALEADLAQAEASRKDRSMALRYHKVKFFERQKVVRKLAQAKKRLAAAADASSQSLLEAAVFELRVDLNYILHYPKSKKYISLFPPEIREGASTDAEKMSINPESHEVRSWIRSQMKAGELPLEPEVQLDSESRGRNEKRAKVWDGNRPSSTAAPLLESSHSVALEQDAFFGEEDEDSSEDNS